MKLAVQSKGTISVALLHEALLQIDQSKLDMQHILRSVGISPEILNSTKARIAVSNYAALWIALADQLNDEFFAMDRHPLRRGTFQLLSCFVMHAQNLQQALQQILQFFNAVFDDLKSELCIENEMAYIIIHDHDQPKRMFHYATYLMLIHGLICWLTGQRIPLNRIHVRCHAPTDDQDYRVRFCEKIHYLSNENSVQFDASYLSILIKQDQSTWYQFIKNTPQNLLVRFKNPHASSAIVRKILLENGHLYWLELHEIAKQMHISEITLQRRLKSEGLNYQQLKNELRCDIAIEYLTQSNYSIVEISQKLHFNDPSAFYRAFKKWTGVNPSAYRVDHENDEPVII